MTTDSVAKLYTPEILGLATQLASIPFSSDFSNEAELRSRTCGSSLKIGLTIGDEGAIARIGMQVSACAIGQASAAIFAQDAIGRTMRDIRASLVDFENWLSGEGDAPAWRGIEALAPARTHTGRHGAMLLPWRAAVEALSKG